MTVATPAFDLTNAPPYTPRLRKTLIAAPKTITGNIDGTNVFEIHDGLNAVTVRIEVGQNINDLTNILEDFASLSVYGRHTISRIHLFTAKDSVGNEFSFAMTYGSLYAFGVLCNLNAIYSELYASEIALLTICLAKVSMSRRFKRVEILTVTPDPEQHCLDGTTETFMATLGEDANDYSWGS